jgi:hypothetical protein
VRPKGLFKLRKLIHLIASRTRDLPACNIVSNDILNSNCYGNMSEFYEDAIISCSLLYDRETTVFINTENLYQLLKGV